MTMHGFLSGNALERNHHYSVLGRSELLFYVSNNLILFLNTKFTLLTSITFAYSSQVHGSPVKHKSISEHLVFPTVTSNRSFVPRAESSRRLVVSDPPGATRTSPESKRCCTICCCGHNKCMVHLNRILIRPLL